MSTAMVPVTKPPKIPRPLYGGSTILSRSSLYSCHWSMTWYRRPPMSAAIATMISPLPMISAFSPKARAWRVITQYASARPTAYAIPYQYSESGPSWRAIAFGVQSIIAAECRLEAMAEFQWWLLLVGLVAGGGLVAVVTMDGRRREEDLADLE